MANGTNITIVGNLTSDPELRFTPSGSAVASFTVAVNERKYNRETGQYEDAGATYWKCNVWRQYAENAAESLSKGDHVFVTGIVKDHSFETKEGDKRTVKEVEVDDMGPTTRFAVAKPQRVQRNDNSNTASAPANASHQPDPWANENKGGDAPF